MDTELAWAAGFFDGEGSVFYSAPTKALQLGIGQATDPWTLHRFRYAVGVGKVHGPYQSKEGWAEQWFYKVNGISTIQHILGQLWPWLGPQKRAQAIEAVHAWVAAPRNRFVFGGIRG